MSQIQVKDDQGVRIISFNRPEKRNAFNLKMYQQLTEYLIQGESDNDIRTFMLRGEGNCFTSGNDIADFLASGELNESHPTVQFLHCLLNLKKPIVAAVSGAAVGIGTTMLLHCDLVYADNSAKFQLPFVNLALVPEAASSLLLPLIVGQQKAAELILLGESFTAETACELNIINRVIESSELNDFVFEQAKKLANQPPLSLQASKKLLRYNQADVKQQMLAELEVFSERLKSDEAKARFQAFLKR
ncbi:enoyl-CoA hydratase [Shewanella sp. 1_MG-2023]|uniref:Enoyl-CoA hydratase n=1 Tax=Shewanella electrodiphila TaxID=934143 RepID=A0ABT0KPC5_9GAMM|nr:MULTISPECIES: enoyl-CoA hydratase [Shewanella]MCC4834089.1 enoyl-CoA hydratase [Shewanella sp. 10N.7]MCL1045688.1 enoyl-CoA hydratase [Shewanella electrodiphila]MDO6613462.1 enoyl-CoA hydratase [Shewanella sp. 7_MG-2023]MDO6773292.1 enoyl-CoA hydratase [Shewanella sp. 2_MG-2023]MDO6795943.1 enoyl-CoA hydratase [Shewanella sp. 1_MG-2023]